MEKELKDMTKAELSKEIKKLQKDVAKSKSALKKNAELEEENKLLIAQMEEFDNDTDGVAEVQTVPKKTQKKLGDMSEFELAEHMSRTTSRKQF